MKRVKQKGVLMAERDEGEAPDNYSVDSFPPIVIKRMEFQST